MGPLPGAKFGACLLTHALIRGQVWKGNDVRHLGYFEDEVAAARAYDRAVLELRGPHAPTNFGPEEYGVAVPGLAAAASDTAEVDSIFLGVSWDAAAGSWKAELWDGREYALLGLFDSEEAAARAYDRACLAQHGEAANTNYPPADYETEMAAAALISAVQRMSDGEEEEASDLEMSALEGAPTSVFPASWGSVPLLFGQFGSMDLRSQGTLHMSSLL